MGWECTWKYVETYISGFDILSLGIIYIYISFFFFGGGGGGGGAEKLNFHVKSIIGYKLCTCHL